jgi:hypothetical protein
MGSRRPSPAMLVARRVVQVGRRRRARVHALAAHLLAVTIAAALIALAVGFGGVTLGALLTGRNERRLARRRASRTGVLDRLRDWPTDKPLPDAAANAAHRTPISPRKREGVCR